MDSLSDHSNNWHLAIAALLFVAGCGDGLSDYDRMQLAQKKAIEALQSTGTKFEEKRYPQGEAWSIDLTGQQISNETFERLKQIGRITELNFSRSTINDAHAAMLNAMEVSGFLLKLDVSNTGFSNAGLAQLKNVNLLMELNVAGAKVTKEGIDKFQESREKNPSIMTAFKRVNVKT